MTGRGAGFCAGSDEAGFVSAPDVGYRPRHGYRSGPGFGGGQGRRRGPWWPGDGGRVRVAIATENGSVAGHFGRCPQYSLVDLADGRETRRVVVDNPGHEPGRIPHFLKNHDANVVIPGTIDGGGSFCAHGEGHDQEGGQHEGMHHDVRR